MNWPMVLNTVLVIAAVVLVGFIALVLVQLSRTLGSLNELVKMVKEELVPEISRTIEEVNSELSRVDTIVKSAEDLSKKVGSTAKVAQEIVSSPLIKLAALSAGIKKALNVLIKK